MRFFLFFLSFFPFPFPFFLSFSGVQHTLPAYRTRGGVIKIGKLSLLIPCNSLLCFPISNDPPSTEYKAGRLCCLDIA